MEIDPAQIASLAPGQARALLPSFLAASVDPSAAPAVHAVVEAVLAQQDDEALAAALARYATVGEGYQLHPADPLVRRVSRAYMGPLVLPGSSTAGVEHLRAALDAGPTLLLGNHRSYVDTQVTDLLLARVDPALADRLVTVAGPKVYDTAFRRFAALGLSTIKTAQSTAVATGEAELSVREVARVAGETVRQAQALMQAGHPVLLYGEGTRSRSGRLGPFLRGVGRYARLDGVQVVPLALEGSEQVMPVGAERLTPAVVRLSLGQPFAAADMDRDAVVERAHAALAALLGEGSP